MKQTYDHVAFVKSFSEPGKRYEIRRRSSDGGLFCVVEGTDELCKAWQFSRRPKSCKHLDAFKWSDDNALLAYGVLKSGASPTVAQIERASERFEIVRAVKFRTASSIVSTAPADGWKPIDSDGPTGVGGQVWVAYRNPNHPDGWNLRVQWTPIQSEHGIEPEFWRPLERPKAPVRP